MCVNSTKPYMVWNRVLQHGIKSAINACFLGALPIRRLIPPCFCLLLILPCLLFWFTSTTLLLQATLLSWFTYSSSTFTAALLSRTSSPWITSSVFKCLVQETPSIYVKRNTYKTCFRGLICLTESWPPLPMSSDTSLSMFDSKPLPNPTPRCQIVWALQYYTITQPDLSFPVNKVC